MTIESIQSHFMKMPSLVNFMLKQEKQITSNLREPKPLLGVATLVLVKAEPRQHMYVYLCVLLSHKYGH